MIYLLKSLWWLVVNVGYLLVILIVSFIVFTVPAQTDDFIYVFLQDVELDYIIAVYLALPLWCYITWYSACIILQIDPIKSSLDRRFNGTHVALSLLVPKILGIIPCMILAWAFLSIDHVTNNNHRFLHLMLTAGTAGIMWFAFVLTDWLSKSKSNVSPLNVKRDMDSFTPQKKLLPFLKQLFQTKSVGNWPSLKEVAQFKRSTKYRPSLAQELIFIMKFTGIRFFYLYLGSVCLLITILMCFPSINLALSSWLRPGALLMIIIACFTLMFTIIAYFHDYARRPFAIVLLIFVILFSFVNDNTGLRYIDNGKAMKRQPIVDTFDEWIKIKKAAWKEKHPDSPMPIVLIATQGGGIRGLSWTSRVFHNLDSTYRGFFEQTFIISGVSGGGVGAAVYLSWAHDVATGDSVAYEKFDSFTRRDFLTPVLGSFAFGDNLQRFCPVPIAGLDRSKMLGRTWDQYYYECLGTNSFAGSFLGMWYTDQGFNYSVPSMIINGTLAENGQRVLTSNLSLSKTNWFEDDIDFFDFTERDISRSTAALNCSRFPYLTSGGLLEKDSIKKGHIVDGGYRENTGLQTLLNVFYSLRDRINKEGKDVRVVVIYLQNGKDERNSEVTAAEVLQDELIPIYGLVQVNGSGMPAKSIVQFARQTMDRSVYANVDFHILSLEEHRKDSIKLPLGWYMSDIVSDAIDQRVKIIPDKDTLMTKTLIESFLK